jgi:hypothetical protein
MNESSIIERALPHSRKDVFVKTDWRVLMQHIPVWHFSNKHSSIVVLLQRLIYSELQQLLKQHFDIEKETDS